MSKSTGVFFLLMFSSVLYGQKKVVRQDLLWYGVYTTININEKWYFQNELQERHYINPTAQHQFVFRGHIHRYLGASGWESSMGMCLFLQNPNDPKASIKLTVPELRPHLEFACKQKFMRLTFDHRIRAEARFFHNINSTATSLSSGYSFGNFRFRFHFQLTVPILKVADKRFLKLKVSDEVHINAGRNIVTNVFDQNRVYGGIGYDVSPNLTVEAGYLNWFQQRPNAEFFNRDIVRFSLFHKVNLRKKND